ncbi:MAG: hypothetical protein F6K45_23130 [Kamptonema sp. SIO1D9]|nr:hypothetical protein [Kamptonema sp. SIO1D9]
MIEGLNLDDLIEGMDGVELSAVLAKIGDRLKSPSFGSSKNTEVMLFR